MTRVTRLLAVALGLIAAGSCGDAVQPEKPGPPPDRPGELRVRFGGRDPLADSGIVFVITAPTPVTMSASAGMQLYERQVNDSTTRVAMIGPLTSGATLLTFAVPDIGAASAFRVQLEAVAGADGQLRALAGYVLTIEP